jgi:DNA replication protein DnaC
MQVETSECKQENCCNGWIYTMDANGGNRRVTGRCPSCHGAQVIAKLLEKAALPPRLKAATFANYDTSEEKSQQMARVFTMKYVDGWRGLEKNGLALAGNVGCGKSHLAVAAARELITAQGVQCEFINMRLYMAACRGGVKNNTVDEIVARAVKAEMLFIDDLGAERLTDFSLDTVSQIIEERYQQVLPVFITTNHPFRGASLWDANGFTIETAEDAALAKERASVKGAEKEHVKRFRAEVPLGDQVGERNFSRLCAMCRVVPVEGRDRRKQ